MKEHQLKCWPEYFDRLKSGEKRFEIRRNDRDFQVGDILVISAWSPALKRFIEGRRPLRFKVTYILHGPFSPVVYDRGLDSGWCIMSLEPYGESEAKNE
jgi:hypothetical protein